MTTPHEDNYPAAEYEPESEAESQSVVATPASEAPEHDDSRSGPTVAGGTWAFLIIGALLLILLLVFILQNQQLVDVNLFNLSWEAPAGVAYLICAIIGALITALVGGWRMFEMRRQMKKARRR